MALLRMVLWLAGVTGWLRAPLSVLPGLMARRAGGGAAVRAVLQRLGGLGAKTPARLLPCLGSARMRQQAAGHAANGALQGAAGRGRRFDAGVLLWLLLAVPLAAQAAAPAGTSVTNVAVLNGSINSTPAQFLVDNRAKVEVVHESGVAAPVNPGGTAWTSFLVTNAGNNAQDYQLTVADVASGAVIYGGTDNFDSATQCQAFVDVNNSGFYEAGVDTVQFIDNLAAGATRRVFMVCTVPAGQVNNDVAALSLMATTHDVGASGALGTQTVKTAGPNTSAVDAVFIDATGSEAVDLAADGRHTARGSFLVTSAASPAADLKVTKAAPAQVAPGASITWTVIVENQGAGTASNAQLTDQIPAGVTGVTAGTVSCAILSLPGSCGAVTVGTPGAGGTPVTVMIPSLAAGGKAAVTIQGMAPAASGTLVNTALAQIPAVTDPTPADNSSSATTTVTGAAPPTGALRGRVWLDADHDRVYDGGEYLYPNFTVNVYNPTVSATVPVATTTTDSIGAYSFPTMAAGVAYEVEFRDTSGNIIFGLPVASEQIGSNSGGAPNSPFVYTQSCATHYGVGGELAGGNCYGVTQGGSVTEVKINGRTEVTLQSGDNVVEQSLPLDPSGVVYDSITRLPVTGATVTFNGPMGVVPAAMLLGGGNPQVTGPSGFYQFILVGAAPAGNYSITVTPPAGYALSATLPVSPFTLDPTAPGAGETGCPNVAPGLCPVQTQGTPPTGAQPTIYFFNFDLAPGDPDVINNHVPLDPLAAGGAATLTLTKQASKSQAGIGEFVQYALTLRNTGTLAAAAPLAVSDVLPPGFRYRAGSARINGALAPDPAVSGDGRTLSFADVSSGAGLAGGGSLTIKYVTEITSGAGAGTATNSARAANATAASNLATASIQVLEDVFRSKAILMGRVVDGVCSMDEAQKLKGVAGVRIFMEDGSYVVTDKDGKWHMENVNPGAHVLQMDVDSLPEGYAPALCEQTARHAGSTFSQFVDVQGGTLWRADFYAVRQGAGGGAAGGAAGGAGSKPTSAAPGKITHRLDAMNTGGVQVRFVLDVQGGSAAQGVSSTIMLPAEAQLVPGSVRVDGQPQNDVVLKDGVMVVRLGDQAAAFARRVEFMVTGMPADARARASTQCQGEGGKAVRLPLVAAPVPPHMQTHTGVVKEALLPAAGKPGAPAPAASGAQQASAPGGKAGLRIYAPGSEKFDAAWLAQAKPGFEAVYPPEEFTASVAATKFFVKHDPAHKITLSVNGTPAHPLDFDGTSQNPARTVALSRWMGVPIRPGVNRFEVVATGKDGKEQARLVRELYYAMGVAHAKLLPDQSQLLADGRSPLVLAVRLTDANGRPARHGADGQFSVNAPHRGWQADQEYAARPTVNAGKGNSYVIGENGVAKIMLAPTMESGEVVLTFNLAGGRTQQVRAWLKPGQRDWILVGLAEGTLAHKTVSGNLQALPTGLEDEKYAADGRVAFYAKGQIQGEYLLTLAYDTAKGKPARGDSSSYLGQGIERERFYTIYGDNSERRHGAPSIRKLYLKIEREAFYAMFGDFDTGLSVTELARYQRVMNGFKSEFRGEDFSYTAFATPTAQAFVRDEIRADGTSGYYALSRQQILAGSERVSLETRDRFTAHRVLKSEPLNRAIDYQVDYGAGTILLRNPAASFDADLNPVYLVVNYESEDQNRDRRLTAGGRLAYRLSDSLEVGATGVHEGNVNARGDLAGVDVRYQFDAATTIRAEYAASRRENFAAAGAPAGAATPAESRGSAYLLELTRQGETVKAKAFFRQQDQGFGLGQGSLGQAGVQTYGMEARLKLSDRLSLDVKGQRDVALPNATAGAITGDRVLGEARLGYTGEGYNLSAGLRGVQDQDLGGQSRSTSQFVAGASTSVLDGALGLRANVELPLAGNNGVADYPRRLVLGADYRVSDTMSAFATQEFTSGQFDKGFATRVGLKSQPWEGADSTSSVGMEQVGAASRVVHSSNFTQSLKLTDELTLTAGMDSVRTLAKDGSFTDTRINKGVPAASGAFSTGGGSSFSNSGVASRTAAALEDYLAVNAGLSWTEGPWGASVRGELRKGDNGNKVNLAGGLHRDIADGEAVALALSLSRGNGAAQTPLLAQNSAGTGYSESQALHADLALHYAFRPVGSKWVVLDRLDFILDKIEGGGAVTQGRKLVNNFNANYLYDRRTQLALQYGAKYVFDTIDGQGYEGFTDLIGVEARRDLNSQWDLGLRAAVLHSWTAENYLLSYGLQLGFSPMQNLWLGLGYNFKGFRDEDFNGANFTGKGWYLSFRYKFDQGEKDIASRRRKMFDEAAR